MIKNIKKKKYENFHEHTRPQKKLITDNNFTYRHILKEINRFLTSPKEVLDIGCGAGTVSLYLAAKENNVLGIDISTSAILSAKKSAELLNLKNAHFKNMDFLDESPKGRFDFIVCTEVIEHLENDELALKKIFSLLKKGGIVLITTPSNNAPLYKMGLTQVFDKNVGHIRRYTLEELIRKSKKCGFNILETGRTEGIVRNYLFINPVGGKLIRFIKFFLSDIITFVDNCSLKLFGESNLLIVIQKPV